MQSVKAGEGITEWGSALHRGVGVQVQPAPPETPLVRPSCSVSGFGHSWSHVFLPNNPEVTSSVWVCLPSSVASEMSGGEMDNTASISPAASMPITVGDPDSPKAGGNGPMLEGFVGAPQVRA